MIGGSVAPLIVKPRGFTVVELLIVIVVIAILAAISIVAYSNVQNRTHDAVVQQDLRQIATQIELYRAQFGVLPRGDSDMIRLTEEIGPIRVSDRSHVALHVNHLDEEEKITYCHPPDSEDYVLMARSRSGVAFRHGTPGTGEFEVPDGLPGSGWTTGMCEAGGVSIAGARSPNRTIFTSDEWKDWVNT